MTIRHLLCHEAGLYHVRHILDHAGHMLDWDQFTEALASSPPIHRPGTAHGYHGFTYGHLIGEVVRRVTGRPFRDVLREVLVEPLELDGFYVGLPADHAHRKAELILSKLLDGSVSIEGFRPRVKRMNAAIRAVGMPVDLAQTAAALLPRGVEELDMNAPSFTEPEHPSANGHFTARDLARMYAMLAAGGELGGVRILSERTVAEASRIQSRGLDRVVPIPMQWRLGYHRAFTAGIKLPRAFGHFGFGGSGAWADPDRDLAVAMVVNSGAGTPFGDARMVFIGSIAARCAQRSF